MVCLEKKESFEKKIVNKISFYKKKIKETQIQYERDCFHDVREYRLLVDNYLIRLDELKKILFVYKNTDKNGRGE